MLHLGIHSETPPSKPRRTEPTVLDLAQVLEVAVKPMLETGELVRLLPEWGDERFPIYAVYPSRNYVPPKVRVFIDFVSSAVSKSTPL